MKAKISQMPPDNTNAVEKATQRLLQIQQLRLFIENLIIPLLLLVINTVLLFATIININIQKIIVLSIFTVFSLLFYILTIIFAKLWGGR